jgi:hypothetical protein
MACCLLQVTSGGQSWAIRRTHANVFMLDEQLHRCVWDRSFSLLEKVVDVAAEGAAAAASNINSSEQEDHSSSSPCHHVGAWHDNRYITSFLQDSPGFYLST